MLAIALVVLKIASAPAAQQSGCTEVEIKALERIAAMMASGDDEAVAAAVARDAGQPTGCARTKLSRLALLGWFEARRLAPKGAPVALLGPVNQRLRELRAITSPELAGEVEYADVTIRAAIAAGQDERPEMGLLLEQARDLTERLVERGRRPLWPRPFNLLAGELWFEVDRYADAATAFERATRADGSPAAFAGLGRSLEALGRHAEACRAFTQIGTAAGALRTETTTFLAGCQ